MNIALMSHDNKKELMVQFCTAYAGILSQHHIYATNATGHMVADATGLNVHCFLSYAHGGSQQIGARIAYNEFDLVLGENAGVGGAELYHQLLFVVVGHQRDIHGWSSFLFYLIRSRGTLPPWMRFAMLR